MSIWSWLFPTDVDRLARARDRMAKGNYEEARAGLLACRAPEAEALYDECCAALAKSDREATRKQLAGDGFHGWKIEIGMADGPRKTELTGLVKEEMGRAGVDLGLPDVDPVAVNAAAARAQRRFRNKRRDVRALGAITLVPIVDADRARR